MTKCRSPPLVIVSHDAHRAGAQHVALHLGKTIASQFGRDVEFVVLGNGDLLDEFSTVGPVHVVTDADHRGAAAWDVASCLRDRGAEAAIVNSVVSGDFGATLHAAGFRLVSLVHELPGVIRLLKCDARADAVALHADVMVFPTRHVEAEFLNLVSSPAGRRVIRPQGLYRRCVQPDSGSDERGRSALRSRFKFPADANIVLGIGRMDARKGFDLFIDAALQVCAANPLAHFIWVGEGVESELPAAWQRWAWSESWSRIRFPGTVSLEELDAFYGGADVFLLTSREDPFPSVMLDALDGGLPVVAFAGSGGAAELLSSGCGCLVPDEDADAMAQQTLRLLHDDKFRHRIGEAGRLLVRDDFSFRRYAFDIAALAIPTQPRVSVVVPNYNYARYLESRLTTIAEQSYPVYELLVLDDASTDDSLDVASRFLAGMAIDHQLIGNTANGGSVFRQWLAGVERARGDLVWIAEADDLAEPDFLERLAPAFSNPEVVMAYCESQQIGADGGLLDASYLDYVSEFGRDRWRRIHTVRGDEALATFLSVKNTIPNVSACLFRRDVLLEALRGNIEEIAGYRVAGDWATYARVLERGRLAFYPVAANRHRRHSQGMTLGAKSDVLMHEILSMQRSLRVRHAPTEEWRRRADDHAQQLYGALGLATASALRLSQHPEFARYFGQNS